MKIGVIGNGVVGNATARCFMEHAEVRVWDQVVEKSTHAFIDVLECDIIFVCLPEAALDEFAKDVHSCCAAGSPIDFNLVIKSTCPIGTTRELSEKYGLKNLVHSPEFLTARCAVTDAQLPARNIIGCVRNIHSGEVVTLEDGTVINTPTYLCPRILQRLYRERFPGVPIHVMTSDESEAVKLFQNGFFAVKVGYFNEINELAAKLGLDWEVIRAAMLADGRIAHSHTQVPGPDGKYGFGGTCLPKDLTQLKQVAINAGLRPSMVLSAEARNLRDRERRQ